MTAPTPVWRGRLGGLDPRAARLNDSLPVDARLWPEELALSRAYALALVDAGVMTAGEADALIAACDHLEDGLVSGTVMLEGEDVHSAVEAELARRCGDPARRLHTGRSRNDQVATLMRMHTMQLCDTAREHVRELGRALTAQARASGERAVAAYTHLQPAQPVLLAHWWMAHAAAFERDEARLQSAREAADVLPLGAGAIAGTPLRYDRVALATRLGFSRLSENSLDAVSDRDFALEYLHAAAQIGIHLSRLAEDLVLWCSPGFGWYRPPEGFSTGSSLLPQKRNPDVFELARGKSARLIAGAQRLAVLLKGLPSGYQKDLQEDKETVFDVADTIEVTLAALAPAIVALEPRPERMRESLGSDLLAIELADALVADGVPFREAHGLVGRLWAEAERAGVPVAALPEQKRLAIARQFTDTLLASLSIEGALARRSHAPGTGPTAVAAQIARAEARLGIAKPTQGGEARPAHGGAASPAIAGTAGRAPEGRSGTLAAPGSQEAEDANRKAGSNQAGTAGGTLEGRSGTLAVPGSQEAEGAASSEAEPWMAEPSGSREAPSRVPPAEARSDSNGGSATDKLKGVTIRRAKLADIPAIAGLMADYVIDGTLLPRPVSELYQCVREFHVAEERGAIVGCASLRLLWDDMGEVRSLALRPETRGRGIGQALVRAVLDDARALELPRVIALTREVPFFERAGFGVVERDTLPRKVWTDCVRCPRRHACDEVAVVLDLVPGASERAGAAGRAWTLPIPHRAPAEAGALPIIP